MSASVSPSDLRTAIDTGIDYLARTQLPSGEFQTLIGPTVDLRDSTPLPRCVYTTSFVIHGIRDLPQHGQVARIRERAADFLEAEEEPGGFWNFEGRGEWRVPAELDTTSCASAALVDLGRRSRQSFFPLLWQVFLPNAAGAGGPFYTYIGVNEQPDDPVNAPFAFDLDPLVNANVLLFSGFLGIALPGTVAYLSGLVRTGDYGSESHYIISPDFPIYTISRAYADGGVDALAPVMPAMRDFLVAGLPGVSGEIPAQNLACRAVALLNLGADADVIEPCIAGLLAAQVEGGGWPPWAAWADIPPNVSGAPALTTAIALEALIKWSTHDGRRRTGSA